MRDIRQQNQKTNLILHIPHASHRIPLDRGYVVGQKTLDQEIIKLTDWYTDDLFLFKDSIPIKADFSRIFCDTERRLWQNSVWVCCTFLLIVLQ